MGPGSKHDFCAEDSVGDYHGKNVEVGKKNKAEEELIEGEHE